MTLPPGPPLPSVVQTALFFTRPAEFVEGCRRRYGPIFTTDTLLFGREIDVADPEMIKQIFTADPADMRAGEANIFLEPLVGPRSVLLLDRAEHLRQRRLMMPPFHGERMLSYASTMTAAAEREIEAMPVGQAFELHPHMQRITLDIILRTVFGVEEGSRQIELQRALNVLIARQGSIVDSLALTPVFRRGFFGLSPWDHFQRDIRRADALIYRQITERRAEIARGGPPRTDVLAMLLEARDDEGRSMTDAELRDELMTLLLAGHETTTTMLCWALDLILGHPRVEERIRADVEAAPDEAAVARLDYLDATVREVLRLFPVIPAVGRKVHAPITLGGYQIPVGETVTPMAYLVHRDPAIYPEPEAFRPERFLDKKPDPYAWLPFGGGVRRCLGMAFAIYEMKLVIAAVVRRTRMRRNKLRPSRITLRSFTFAPEGGGDVFLEKRA